MTLGAYDASCGDRECEACDPPQAVQMPERIVGCRCEPLPERDQPHSIGCRMKRAPIEAALVAVAHGRAYTVEHFGFSLSGKYVGHVPADEYDRAVDALVAWVDSHLRVRGR